MDNRWFNEFGIKLSKEEIISKTNSKIKESTGYFRFMIIKDNQPIKYYKELTINYLKILL